MPQKLVSNVAHKKLVREVEELRKIVETLRQENVELTTERDENNRKDYLTECYNRRAYDEIISREMSRALRDGTPLVLAVFDIDFFKSINDTGGHKAGDQMLKSLAHKTKCTVREGDSVARYGGDEFVIILPNTNLDGSKIQIARLQETMSDLRAFWAGKTFTATISIGVAEMIAGESAAELFDRADKTLYVAKKDGRNCARYAHVLKRKKHMSERKGDRRSN